MAWPKSASFLKKYFTYLFLDKEEEKEKEKERDINVWLPLMYPQPGDLARNPVMCPDWELNQRPFDLQAGAQSTDPHCQGLKCKI